MFHRALKTPSITHVCGVEDVGERERIERPARTRPEVCRSVRLNDVHRSGGCGRRQLRRFAEEQGPYARDRGARPGAGPPSDILATVLLRHAVPIVAHFDWALAVTLAAPEASLRPLVAPGLSLDSFRGWGFLAAACVKTYQLRPRGVPAWMGIDFFLVGYRIFVRFESSSGRRFRGLQILGSETDRWIMAIGGSVFTYYAYRKVRARVDRDGRALRVATSSGFDIAVKDEAVRAPVSVFADWDEARRYAGPMPFTFASVDRGRAIVRVEGSRVHWEPRPVAVISATMPFLTRLVPDAVAVAAFLVEDVDYAWKRGIVERLPS